MKIYVSPKTYSYCDGSNKYPFSTIEQALNKSRECCDAVTIILMEGTHYINEPILLSSSDSGLSIISHDGDMPILSGGKNITGKWTPYKDGIYMVKVNDVDDFTELFINGKRQIRARYPNIDIDNFKEGFIHGVTSSDWPNTYLGYDKNTFSKKTWSNPTDGVVHIFANNYWGNLQWEVSSINYSNETIHFGKGGYQINDVMQGAGATGIGERSLWYVENIFEELDVPNEWYFDKANKVLYYYPDSSINLDNAIVEVPCHDSIIRIIGCEENPVSNITLSGIKLAHTNPTFLKEYIAPSLGDWTIHTNGAIYIQRAKHCVIKDCFFDQNGGNSIYFNLFNTQHVVKNNIIKSSGESGICLTGDKYRTLGSQHFYPYDIDITNNIITNIGRYGKQTAGVFVSIASSIKIRHNKIYDIPRAAICINDGTWGGHIIEYNDIYDTVKETGDHGPFNSWGRDRFWCYTQSHYGVSHEAGDVLMDAREPVIINQNRFVDNKGWGIDLDDGTSNYIVKNNLCIGISVKLREGDYRRVENNIFIKGANPPGFHIGNEFNHDAFCNNIIVSDANFDNPEIDVNFDKGDSSGLIYHIIGPPMKGPWFNQWDNNLFFSSIGRFKMTVMHRAKDGTLRGGLKENMTLEQWQEKGFDKNSLYADPCFVDSENDNYELKKSSPAFKLGFKPLVYDKFGPLDFKSKWDL